MSRGPPASTSKATTTLANVPGPKPSAVPKVAMPAGPDSSSLENFGATIQNTDPGSNAGIPGLQVPAGLGARDTLRTEMGYPLHGQDISPDITPVQARSGWAVGFGARAGARAGREPTSF